MTCVCWKASFLIWVRAPRSTLSTPCSCAEAMGKNSKATVQTDAANLKRSRFTIVSLSKMTLGWKKGIGEYLRITCSPTGELGDGTKLLNLRSECNRKTLARVGMAGNAGSPPTWCRELRRRLEEENTVD